LQNALTYVLLSRRHFDPALVAAFSEAYASVFPLSSEEASLVRVVMLDRVIWLIADLLGQIRRQRSRRRERMVIRLIRLARWLGDHGDRLTGELMAHAKPRARH
jgi:Ser/Thr protein kinase RdoA (MazF antagonist)